MRKWIIIIASCISALFWPCGVLHCWDTAGNRVGSWSETSCDGYTYSGNWSGYVTNDCRFFGTGKWAFVNGSIDWSSKDLAATGIIRRECGPITMTGTFTNNLISLSGEYEYSNGGHGTFTGRMQP